MLYFHDRYKNTFLHIRTMTWKQVLQRTCIVLGIMVIVGVVVDSVLMPWITTLRATVTVPNVVGKSKEEAVSLLEGMGLKLNDIQEQYSASVPAGTVISQLPYASATVKEGRRVYLTISSGARAIAVPTIVGQPLRNARLILLRLGLQLGEVRYEPNDSVPEEYVVWQSVQPGQKTATGSVVTVVVSKGANGVAVPDCTGLQLQEAEEVLRQAGLALGTVQYGESGTYQQHSIYGQIPPATERVAVGTSVSVMVVK
jgi:beta-lactam-binding protein with PASTA domain